MFCLVLESFLLSFREVHIHSLISVKYFMWSTGEKVTRDPSSTYNPLFSKVLALPHKNTLEKTTFVFLFFSMFSFSIRTIAW